MNNANVGQRYSEYVEEIRDPLSPKFWGPFRFIEGFYNIRRLHSALYVSPANYEKLNHAA